MKKLLLAGVAACAVGLASTGAEAALSAQVFVDADGAGPGGFVQLGVTQSTLGGLLLTNFANPTYNVSVTLTGAPLIPSPDMGGSTTTVEASANGIVRIELSQTDVPAASAGGINAALASTFSTNFLIGQDGVTSVEIHNFVDAGNVAFATTTPLSSATFLGAGAPVQTSGPSTGEFTTAGAFSQTMVFTVTFNGNTGLSQVQANSQIVAVPEPASIALLGMGLLGLAGMTRARRKA
jgi:hypothetical protein